MPLKVVVIGGGASGLAAAITAAWGGAEVIILEHKDRVGKKILMTGNGKCNLTNVSDYHGKYYGEDVERIYSFLDRFSSQDTIAFSDKWDYIRKRKEMAASIRCLNRQRLYWMYFEALACILE